MKTKTIEKDGNNTAKETVIETAPHSIDLSCNAKGQYSWSIKLYFKEEDKEHVVGDIEKINQEMQLTFPNVDDLAKITELDKKAKK
jgi:hypothetical protein